MSEYNGQIIRKKNSRVRNTKFIYIALGGKM